MTYSEVSIYPFYRHCFDHAIAMLFTYYQILDKWIAFVESEKLNLKAEGNTLKQRSETNGNSSGVVMGTSDIDLLSNNRHRTGSNSSIGSSSSNSVSAHSAPSSSVSAMDDTEGQFSLYRHAAEASHGTSELPNNLLPVRSRGAEAINMHFARIDVSLLIWLY